MWLPCRAPQPTECGAPAARSRRPQPRAQRRRERFPPRGAERCSSGHRATRGGPLAAQHRSDAPPDDETSTSSSDAAAARTGSPSTSGRPRAAASEPATLQDVQAAAAARGLSMKLSTLGPFYRITCREGSEKGQVLAIVNGFVAPPFGIMHIDTMQILASRLQGERSDRLRGGTLGMGLLLGGAAFAHGLANGCRKAEILAINDDDYTHRRLVRYYSYFGFKPVCTVGDQGFLRDLPHLLVWGGEGTRMDADIGAMLRRWTPALRKQAGEGWAAAAAAAADQQHQQSPSAGPSQPKL